jgi:hypothetical protein
MIVVNVFNIDLPYVFSVIHEIPNASYFTLIKHEGGWCACGQLYVIVAIIRHSVGWLMKEDEG